MLDRHAMALCGRSLALRGERTFSDDFLAYAHGTGLSLDWVWLNDERSLVIGAFHAAKDACPMLEQISELFDQLDDTEQLIFLAGAQGLSSGVFDAGGFTAWTEERVRRHRAGEALRVSDLALPKAG